MSEQQLNRLVRIYRKLRARGIKPAQAWARGQFLVLARRGPGKEST